MCSISKTSILTREAYLRSAPDGLSEQEKEIWWMVAWIRANQEASKEFGFPIDPGKMERLRRELPQLQSEALNECREAVSVLNRHLNENTGIVGFPAGPMLWIVPPEVAEDIDQSINYLNELIDCLQRDSRQPVKPSRPPSTKSMYVRKFWPILRHLGFSMRASSKLLSEAFKKSGLTDEESDDDRKQQESIYQTIRNLGSR